MCVFSGPPTALYPQVLLFPWTDKETEAQRHERTCKDQQQESAGASVCSTCLTPEGFKAWAFSKCCSLDVKFLSLACEHSVGTNKRQYIFLGRRVRGWPTAGARRDGLTGKEGK